MIKIYNFLDKYLLLITNYIDKKNTICLYYYKIL